MSARLLRYLFSALLLLASLPVCGQSQLPNGAGKEIMQTACTGCHELARVLRAGYSERDCKTVLRVEERRGAAA
jgi:virginiamycin B lyase